MVSFPSSFFFPTRPHQLTSPIPSFDSYSCGHGKCRTQFHCFSANQSSSLVCVITMVNDSLIDEINGCCCRLLCDFQLGGMQWDPSLTFAIRPKRGQGSGDDGSGSDDSFSPKKPRRMAGFDLGRFDRPGIRWSDDEGSRSNNGRPVTPGTPPINRCRPSRRKGIPQRAPFYG